MEFNATFTNISAPVVPFVLLLLLLKSGDKLWKGTEERDWDNNVNIDFHLTVMHYAITYISNLIDGVMVSVLPRVW
jgi:hypothetical protein